MQNGLEREWIEERQVSSPLDKQEIRDRIGGGRGVFILLLVLFFFFFFLLVLYALSKKSCPPKIYILLEEGWEINKITYKI